MRRTTLEAMSKRIESRRSLYSANNLVAPKNNGKNRSSRKMAILKDMNERANFEGRSLKFPSNF